MGRDQTRPKDGGPLRAASTGLAATPSCACISQPGGVAAVTSSTPAARSDRTASVSGHCKKLYYFWVAELQVGTNCRGGGGRSCPHGLLAWPARPHAAAPRAVLVPARGVPVGQGRGGRTLTEPQTASGRTVLAAGLRLSPRCVGSARPKRFAFLHG